MKIRISIALALMPLLAGAQIQSISLENALAQARANRATIQAARLRLDQARLSRRAFGAFPATTLSLGYSSDQRIGGTDDDLVLTQPIDIFGRSAAGRNAGDALILQAEASYRQAVADLQGDIVGLYGETAASGERVRISRATEELASRLFEAIKGLVEGGKLPGVQAARVSIELERARASRELREAELDANTKRLAGAIGIAPDATRVDGFAKFAPPETADALLASQRTDLLLLSAEVKAAEADARIARTERLPQLEIQGRRTAWQDPQTAYGARLQLTFPLFDSGRSRAEVSAASKRVEAARKALADATRIANAEYEAARIEVAAATKQIQRLEAILESTRTLADKTQTGLREGANTLLDVLDALRTLREIEENIVDAKLSLATAQARHLRATGTLLGGGK